MDKKASNNKDKLLELIKGRISRADDLDSLADKKFNDQQMAALLGELQIYQLELEMQNDELSVSYQMLENERGKFAGFFDLAPVGYFVLNHLGIVEEANQTGVNLLGISKSAILHSAFNKLVEPESLENFYAFLHRMQSSEQRHSCEVTMKTSKAELLYIRMEGIIVKNTFTGKQQYYVAIIDITESKIAEKRLIETSQRLEMTLRASGTGTWTMEMGTNKLFLDEYSYSILEINQWEFDGTIKRFIDLIHPEDQINVRQTLLSSSQTLNEIDFEFRMFSKGGSLRYISAKGHQVYNYQANNYFAGIIMDVSERKRIAKQAEEIQSEKQRLVLSATFNAQEKERYRISNALHDSVCQILYGIRLNLQNVRFPSERKDELKSVNVLLDQAIRETREISYELTPSVLRDFGFTAGIREMAQRLSTHNFKISSNVEDTADALDKEVQLYVFRMIQELINNCIKHSHATKAEITVGTKDNTITLVVSDNGKGIATDTEQALSNGSGLRGIKNRIFLLNGFMDLKTSDKGTKVTLIFKSDARPITTV